MHPPMNFRIPPLMKCSSIEMLRILFDGLMFSRIGMSKWLQQTHKRVNTPINFSVYLFLLRMTSILVKNFTLIAACNMAEDERFTENRKILKWI